MQTPQREEINDRGSWYLTKSVLDNSPSMDFLRRKCAEKQGGGDDADLLEKARKMEAKYRLATCGFLQEAGQRLRLPQLTIASAIVFYHRFFTRHSYEDWHRIEVATTSLFLASKVEETPKKLKDVVATSYELDQKEPPPAESSEKFLQMKDRVLICERCLLQALNFDLSLDHPYKPLLAYVKSINGSRDLAQVAWNFINDSFRTTLCLQARPRTPPCARRSLAADLSPARALCAVPAALHLGRRAPALPALFSKEGPARRAARLQWR